MQIHLFFHNPAPWLVHFTPTFHLSHSSHPQPMPAAAAHPVWLSEINTEATRPLMCFPLPSCKVPREGWEEYSTMPRYSIFLQYVDSQIWHCSSILCAGSAAKSQRWDNAETYVGASTNPSAITMANSQSPMALSKYPPVSLKKKIQIEPSCTPS